jgi:hypothetical protein
VRLAAGPAALPARAEALVDPWRFDEEVEKFPSERCSFRRLNTFPNRVKRLSQIECTCDKSVLIIVFTFPIALKKVSFRVAAFAQKKSALRITLWKLSKSPMSMCCQ